MIAIHPAHRELAKIAWMSTNKKGEMIIGDAEIRLMMPLLRKNLELVMKTDELKSFSLEAYCTGDMDLVHELEDQLLQLELMYN